MAADLLQVEGLDTGYGPVGVVHDLSLSVASGEVVCLIGANGAGKSTVMQCLAGVLPGTAGTVHLDGEDIAALPPPARITRGLVLVPEGRRLFGSLTVEQNLLAATIPLRLSRGDRTERLEGAIGLFPRLADRRRQTAGTMSGGEQQMLAIARAMVTRPRLLLLDEPSTGLAPALVAQVFEQVADLRGSGLSVLVVEQNATVLDVADRGYVLAEGTVARAGDAADLAGDPEIARIYLGR